jgi:hypothetical protein
VGIHTLVVIATHKLTHKAHRQNKRGPFPALVGKCNTWKLAQDRRTIKRELKAGDWLSMQPQRWHPTRPSGGP